MMMDDEGQERVRASYRDNYDRLAKIKAKYDPDNLFHVNQNIKPAAASGAPGRLCVFGGRVLCHFVARCTLKETTQ